MFNQIFQKMKKLINIIIIVFFLSLLIVDYNNFNNKQSSLLEISDIDNDSINIIGNHCIPLDVILKVINDYEYDARYNLLIDDLKTITMSNNEKTILIDENLPLFYDKKYIYLSSNDKIESDLDLDKKEKLAFLELDGLDSDKYKYRSSIRSIRKFVNHLNNSHNDFYDKLDKIVYNNERGDYSPHASLSIFIDGCRVVLSDGSFGEVLLKQEDFEYKINILKNVLNQHNKKIEEVKEVDLRYSDNHIVFFNLIKEDVDG